MSKLAEEIVKDAFDTTINPMGLIDHLRRKAKVKIETRLITTFDLLDRLFKAAEHWSACDCPDEVRYRCGSCVAAESALKGYHNHKKNWR